MDIARTTGDESCEDERGFSCSTWKGLEDNCSDKNADEKQSSDNSSGTRECNRAV